MMDILKELSRPKKARSEESEWKLEGTEDSLDGEEIGSRARGPVEGKGDNEGNEMDFDDDDEEMVVPLEDDDDEDFYVPSLAQKEKKMKRSKAAGGGKAGHASKCGRGRKQCPNCQIVVPTCRTQCTECSYQFVIHSSSPGDGGGDGAAEQSVSSAATTTTGPSEASSKAKTVGVKKHLTKKRKKEGLAGKSGKKDTSSHLDSPATKVSKIDEPEAVDGNAASGSDSEMASVEQASIAGSDDPRQRMESPAGDGETVQLERVGKGYKRCPKCSTVQGSSYAKCPKCDYAFTSKVGKGNPKKERGKPVPLARAKLTNGIRRLSGSSFSKPVEKTGFGNGTGSERINVFSNRVLRGEESGNQIDVAGLYRQNREAKKREEQFVQDSDRGPIVKYGNNLTEQCMADLLQCVPDDNLAELIQALYSKQLEEYEQVEAELKRTEGSYNEMLALQTEADRQIQKATLQANELIVQLAASQQELKQLDDEMKVAVNGRQNAKKKLERRCLEFETLKLRLKEVLGPDYKPNAS